MSDASDRAHSDDQFGEQRDSWYHRDFIALFAQRLGPATQARRMLDVGFGQGHWSAATLLPLFPELMHLTGVDFEARWITEAPANFARRVGGRTLAAHFVRADAHELPFPDDSFDVVTCQTVLMHLRDARRALGEMFRVVRPGGLVLVSEPNNLVPFILADSASRALGLEVQAARCRLWLAIFRGRIDAGQGDWCIGDELPALFKGCGAKSFHVIQNDKVQPVLPPYDRETRVGLDFEIDWLARTLGEDRAQHHDFAVRGGLDAREADRLIAVELACHEERKRQVGNGTFYASGGSIHYLAWGTKPVSGVPVSQAEPEPRLEGEAALARKRELVG